MESDAFFQEKVYLTPKDLRSDIQSIDGILLDKLRQRMERRCTSHGYVLPGTLELLTRSAGSVDSGKFTGDWAFIVKAKGRVLHPPEGAIVTVEILKFNKMGIYAVYEKDDAKAIRIMVPRDLHLGDEEFDSLKVGEFIRVEIQKSRFQLRDEFIVSVGVFRGRAEGPAEPLVPVAEDAEGEEGEEAEGEETAAVTAAAAAGGADGGGDAEEDEGEEEETE